MTRGGEQTENLLRRAARRGLGLNLTDDAGWDDEVFRRFAIAVLLSDEKDIGLYFLLSTLRRLFSFLGAAAESFPAIIHRWRGLKKRRTKG